MSISGSFIFPHPPLIIPEVGKGQEAAIQKTIDAYEKCAMQIARLKPETIILISPHSTMYLDYFHISPGKKAQGDFGNFQAKKVRIEAEYDEEFVSALEKRASICEIPAGTMGEKDARFDHGTMVPLYFVNQFYKDYKLVRIGLSGLSPTVHYRFGICISETVLQLKKKVVIIASGDLSHKLLAEGPYGFTQEGLDFDKQVTEAMAEGNFLKFLLFDHDFLEKAAECGLKSFQIMAGALEKQEVESELISYEGPFGVGYGVASFLPTGDSNDRALLDEYQKEQDMHIKRQREKESEYVKLARHTLEQYVMDKKIAEFPENLPENFYSEKAGVFVSIKKHGKLRGCIGTILPVQENIAEEIKKNAISAGTGDPRFEPVEKEELKELEYSVDVLTEPESIASADELDVKKYGVIISHGRKMGVLLPDLVGVDTVEEQIQIAKQKAGIRDGEEVSLSRFEVVRHK